MMWKLFGEVVSVLSGYGGRHVAACFDQEYKQQFSEDIWAKFKVTVVMTKKMVT